MTAEMSEMVEIGTLKFTSVTEASSVAQLVARPNLMPAVTSSNPARIAVTPLIHPSSCKRPTSDYHNFQPTVCMPVALLYTTFHLLNTSRTPFNSIQSTFRTPLEHLHNTYGIPFFRTPLEHLQNTFLLNTFRTPFVTTREVTSHWQGEGCFALLAQPICNLKSDLVTQTQRQEICTHMRNGDDRC